MNAVIEEGAGIVAGDTVVEMIGARWKEKLQPLEILRVMSLTTAA